MKTHTQSTHTPGPWRIFQDRNGDETQLHVFDAENYKLASIEPWRETAEAEAEANARLIASAPDLLAALEEAQNLIRIARNHFPKSMQNSDRFQLENICASIGKAIAKAKGTP